MQTSMRMSGGETAVPSRWADSFVYHPPAELAFPWLSVTAWERTHL